MRFLTRSLLGLFLAAATFGVLALAGEVIFAALQSRMAGGEGGAPPAAERSFTAAVQRAEPQEVQPQMTVFGEVRARRSLELRAPQAGRVIWLAEGFEDGAAVIAGQPLLRLDPADAQAARDLAQSDIAKAQAEVDEAARALLISVDELAGAEARAKLQAQALGRQQDLAKRGVGSDAAVEAAALTASNADQAVLSQRSSLSQAQTRVDLAKTALSRQEITLAEADRALDDTEIRAGFDGVLDQVTVVAGGLVNGNEKLAVLIDPQALEVAFRLSTAQYGRLVDASGRLVSAPVTLSMDLGSDTALARGQLARVNAAVGTGQAGRLVYATLDAAPNLRPGDFVTVQIAEPALQNVIVLPAAALGVQDDVLVLGNDDRLETVTVQVLRRQGDEVLITAPELAGREVVVQRSPLLGQGIRIKPLRDGASEAPPEAMELTAERRAALIAYVEGNKRMPAEAKARVLAQLAQEKVPADVVTRLEQRMGG